MKSRFLTIAVLVMAALFMVAPSFAQDEPGTIADIVVASTTAETPEFTILLAAVSAADPAVLELLSNPEANVTVFAPTDAAFAAALEALGVSAEDLLADTAMLTNILLYHVVPGSFAAEAVVALDGALIGTMYPETALSHLRGRHGRHGQRVQRGRDRRDGLQRHRARHRRGPAAPGHGRHG
ncbi:MAG: fasciclin domain-containing protein [Chloroflexi bacterium]|nr:fasciclin domain-containing protein [Chloroflexota bacterium]